MTTETLSLDAIAAMIKAGRCDEASEALEGFPETDENRCEVLLLRGRSQGTSCDLEGAFATYAKVLELDPENREALFCSALAADQVGDDDTALELYERCASLRPVPVNALVNLAVLYEELGDLAGAERCLFSVLDEYPTHRRAEHFLRSVDSSYTMVFDEKSQKDWEQHSAILDLPISEFELSVRSRNCLRQMNIRTLGDLLRTTEPELLSYKNFGETSLNEIKAMLEQKNLRIGEAAIPSETPVFRPLPAVSGDPPVDLHRSVSELELSVRSRKCLQRLGITTLEELCRRSEAELMSTKNFGQTSLVEIQGQLARCGLSLRTLGA